MSLSRKGERRGGDYILITGESIPFLVEEVHSDPGYLSLVQVKRSASQTIGGLETAAQGAEVPEPMQRQGFLQPFLQPGARRAVEDSSLSPELQESRSGIHRSGPLIGLPPSVRLYRSSTSLVTSTSRTSTTACKPRGITAWVRATRFAWSSTAGIASRARRRTGWICNPKIGAGQWSCMDYPRFVQAILPKRHGINFPGS